MTNDAALRWNSRKMMTPAVTSATAVIVAAATVRMATWRLTSGRAEWVIARNAATILIGPMPMKNARATSTSGIGGTGTAG
jgi:hypothetical protein